MSERTNLDPAAADRRRFLLQVLRAGGLGAVTLGLGTWLGARSSRPQDGSIVTLDRAFTVPPDPNLPEMAISSMAADPRTAVRKAIEAMGGMGRFVARGDVVVIKPNIGWDRTPEQGANTHPLAVKGLIEAALQAAPALGALFVPARQEPR